MKHYKHFRAIIALILCTLGANANDIQVSNATLTGQNTTSDFTLAQFDINWSNSWRVGTGPNNWDAAWVFVKYRIEGGAGCTPGDWQHATLHSTGHSITTNNGVPGTITPSADGKGVFMYRSGNGSGAIDWDQVQLRWNYGVDGLLDNCNVSIKVFAIEMVYVPQSSFFIGDGASNNGQFEDAVSGNPFQVTGEGALTLGGGGAGSVGNNNTAGETAPVDDFNDATSVTLPATFPKGFAHFYSMKYEISQEQYAEFLNVLTPTQQLARHGATVVNRYFTNATTPPNRNGVKCTVLPVIATSTVGTYECDLNNNGIGNETDDGQNVAFPYLSSMDLLSYLDWAALRPMTEFELEKLARGTNPSVLNEYAWGSTSLHATSYAALTNAGAGNELPNSPSTTLGNAAYSTTANVVGIQGPLRVGIFATATSSRVVSGASYYGAMELTGNVWEMVVGVGGLSGRSFRGAHGNGTLTASGFADADYWPGSNGNSNIAVANIAPNPGSTSYAGMMFRMGSWSNPNWLRVSDRQYPGWTGMGNRDSRMGGRGIRTAP